MTNQLISNERHILEAEVIDHFLVKPGEESFAALYKLFHPQVVAFFRARIREFASAEDLAQDVMLTVYSKARQIRDRMLFRAWLFKVAHNALCRHYGCLTREVDTVDLAEVENSRFAASQQSTGTPAFEFLDWMTLLDARERDVMMLRFIEQWEYHEIAAYRNTPIGTVQWRVFNSKKKLAKHLSVSPRQHRASRGDRRSAGIPADLAAGIATCARAPIGIS